jgi:sulfur-carrier protein
LKILIPSVLLSYTSALEVEATGATLGQIFDDLDRRYPGLRFRVIDEQDKIRRHMRCFINGDPIFELSQEVHASDELIIIQALSGG